MLKRTAGESSTAPRPRAPKTWQANALVAVATLVVAMIAAEALLRSTDLRYLRHPNIQYPAGYYREDPVLGTDLAPNRPPAPVIFKGPTFQTYTNALGCFDHEGPIGEGYLLAIGDSSTWGYAPLEDKWTSHLERWSGRRVVKCAESRAPVPNFSGSRRKRSSKSWASTPRSSSSCTTVTTTSTTTPSSRATRCCTANGCRI
jgi:hypothetical protein